MLFSNDNFCIIFYKRYTSIDRNIEITFIRYENWSRL